MGKMQPVDLENHQDTPAEQGASPRTIDMELGYAKSLVKK
jgi:hypothetical protein